MSAYFAKRQRWTWSSRQISRKTKTLVPTRTICRRRSWQCGQIAPAEKIVMWTEKIAPPRRSGHFSLLGSDYFYCVRFQIIQILGVMIDILCMSYSYNRDLCTFFIGYEVVCPGYDLSFRGISVRPGWDLCFQGMIPGYDM